MQTRNVHYAQQPDRVIIRENAGKAIIELPINVAEITIERDGETITEWVAEKVYYAHAIATPNIKERVENNYNAWLELASRPDTQQVTMDDLVEAINALTDIILGGEM